MAAPYRVKTRRVAYVALGWVVVFFGFHVYWYAGGSFGSPGSLPGLPHSIVAWAFSIIVGLSFPLGAWVCLAIAQHWVHQPFRVLITFLVWTGCVLLLVRGVAGIIDDLTRATGLLPNGLTGLTIEQTTGVMNPSSYLIWSGQVIDAYFLIGGIIFGALAFRNRADTKKETKS